jgi:hypothetical protein
VIKDAAQVAAATDDDERRHLLNVLFPQTRRACEYPSSCVFINLCYGSADIRRDPISSGKYRPRVANHPQEVVLDADKKQSIKLLLMTEEWKDIPSLAGKYQASNLGRIRYVRVLKALPTANTDYLAVTLTHGERKQERIAVHVLVGYAFLGPRPEHNRSITSTETVRTIACELGICDGPRKQPSCVQVR